MATVTRVQALIIALPNQPIPGHVKNSFGLFKLIQSSSFCYHDLTRPEYETGRNHYLEEMENAIEFSGHILIGEPTIVRVDTREERFEIVREREH